MEVSLLVKSFVGTRLAYHTSSKTSQAPKCFHTAHLTISPLRHRTRHHCVHTSQPPSYGTASQDPCVQPLPHGGARPFHPKSTCISRLTLGPNVVQIWSHDTPESGTTETFALNRVAFGVRVPDFGIGVWGFGFRVSSFGLKVED